MNKLQQPHLEFLRIIQSDNTKNECEYDAEDDQILTPKKCHGGGRRLGGLVGTAFVVAFVGLLRSCMGLSHSCFAAYLLMQACS
ncbi:hypothetical protein SETIT_1G088300v2 [Setaria italica]|uniref:Uncharacterized protein n=2 Tax=Setaria TaxID=4554 RepID=A0A368PIA2_SETIT|nr:hypothetical protein SETIT_1G088300v2 [Setaria italica]TKW37998.1 hypothetical protein SEVIR_1G086400v2 [Setaria viridis]